MERHHGLCAVSMLDIRQAHFLVPVRRVEEVEQKLQVGETPNSLPSFLVLLYSSESRKGEGKKLSIDVKEEKDGEREKLSLTPSPLRRIDSKVR